MSDWQIEDAPYQHWIETVERPTLKKLVSPWLNSDFDDSWPLISIVIPTYNSPVHFLQIALESILAQSYPKWQLCIADDSSDLPNVFELLSCYRERDSRIKITKSPSNGGIAAATNSALRMATGQYLAFVDHDDKLSVDALLLVAMHLKAQPTARLLYTDSDSIDSAEKRSNPYFKPDWNYELFLGQNYLNHLTVVHRGLVEQLGGLREGFEGSQDYDLVLRVIEHIDPSQIHHLPHVLYHWRVVPSAVSQTQLADAVHSGRRALAKHLERCGLSGRIGAPQGAVIYNRVNWSTPDPLPTTHVVIYGESPEVIEETVMAFDLSSGPNLGIKISKVVVPKGQRQPQLGRMLARQCSAVKEDNICLLAAGLYPKTPNWLTHLAGLLSRNTIGLVAPKIVNSQGAVVSGPLTLGTSDGIGGAHPKGLRGRSSDGYFKRLRLDHQVSAAHGACLMIRRSVLEDAGGINPQLNALLLIGADTCLKIQTMGFHCIWAASIEVECSEQALTPLFLSSPATTELQYFEHQWPEAVECDRYYNANLCRSGVSYSLPC